MDLLYILIAVFILIGTFEAFLLWRKYHQFSERDKALVVAEWNAIREKIGREPKHALIDADKLLDFVLKKKGYEGSLGEKLKKAAPLFSHIDDVWEAHKLRNRAVHEVGFVVHEEQARRALSAIKQGLFELGVKF